MLTREKRKNTRNEALVQDVIHVIIGVVTVVLSVITFLDPEGNSVLLPVIFFLAAFLNGMNGFHKYQNSGRDRKKKRGAFMQLLAAVFLFLVMIVSAVSIWR